MADEELPLAGGWINEGIVRVGNTVRRPIHQWSSTIHALLEHFERVGFDGAPRFLGIDEKGREVLSFCEGGVIWEEHLGPLADTSSLRTIAGRIREFHDATTSFSIPPGAQWSGIESDPDGGSLIIHNDLGPWNVVVGEHIAVIDWDWASPGRAEWELAHVFYTFGWFWEEAPPWRDEPLASPEVADRVVTLATGYGADDELTRLALHLTPARCHAIADNADAQVALGNPAFVRLAEEGHPETWRRAAEHGARKAAAVLDHLFGEHAES